MSHAATDIFGKPLTTHHRTTRTDKNASTPLPFSAVHSRHLARGASAVRRSHSSLDRSPSPSGSNNYIALANAGAFKKRGLGHQWTAGRLEQAQKVGPYVGDLQNSRHRNAEEQLRVLARLDISAASSVDRRLRRTEHHLSVLPSPNPFIADDLHSIVSPEQRGSRSRPAVITLPSLLHQEDPSYVDIYRNFLDDRERRITAKQQVAYLRHDRFVIDPNTKLRTLEEHRQKFSSSLKPPSEDPVSNPDAYMPPSLTSTRHRRTTIEDCEEADTAEYAREAFRSELRRLCSKHKVSSTPRATQQPRVLSEPPSTAASQADHGFKKLTDVAGKLSRVEMPEYNSPQRMAKAPWATMDRSKAYPYQTQKAMRNHADEHNMKHALKHSTN
jgi:hypothetical protein